MNEQIIYMTIDFGNVKSYDSNKGFGFVDHTFHGSRNKVFFHIKKIKKKYPELAQKLDNNEDFEMINFWYEVEETEKGEQVGRIWMNTEDIPQSYKSELPSFVRNIEHLWKSIYHIEPTWLDLVTIDLVGIDRRDELSIEREKLKTAEENRRKEIGFLRLSRIREIAEKYNLIEVEADELNQLLGEIRRLNFTHSSQLSVYIMKNNLGYQYRNISGILRMESEGNEWNFHGGFPPDIYKIICKELDLSNQGTTARAVGFTPFKDI